MCGFVGEFSGVAGRHCGPATLDVLTDQLERRGPDGRGTWLDEHCALGFRRLAILDRTPAGDQPMVSPDGRYVLVCNGELYNFRELRPELEAAGWPFRSTGDAEVVLAALATWGTDALERFNAMFALAFYDRAERTVVLARDHVGIKPLYLADTRDGVFFSSEYRQLLAHPDLADRPVDHDRLSQFVRLSYVAQPGAPVVGTAMVDAGTWLRVAADGSRSTGRFFEFPHESTGELVGEEANEAVTATVAAAVQRQMVSDVPVGAFLSGGIDSPLVAAEASRTVPDIETFTLRLTNPARDESGVAAGYAQQLGLSTNFVDFADADAEVMAVVDEALQSSEGELFADPSIIPTLAVCGAAASSRSVMLSGDGGDELFWGYVGRFSSVLALADQFRHSLLHRTARRGVARALGIGNPSENLRWPTIGRYYFEKHSQLPPSYASRIFPDLPIVADPDDYFTFTGSGQDATAEWMRWNEVTSHLRGVLLKVDRAAMFHSLEVRVPLLDREVIEVATRVDWRSCLDLESGLGKLPLRHALFEHVSTQSNAKLGFDGPLDDWFHGILGDRLLDELADRDELAGVPFDRSGVWALLDAHRTGDGERSWALWTLLVLSQWDLAWKAARAGARSGSWYD